MHKDLALLTATLLLSACATDKVLVPTGGSRADGTVELAYEVGGFEKPILNPGQGIAAARSRCSAWGYADAEPFGGEKRQCQYGTGYGCDRWLVTVSYQCIGGKAGAAVAPGAPAQ